MQNGRSVVTDYAGSKGILVSDLDPILKAWILVGAEGEGDGGSGGDSGGGSGDGSGSGNGQNQGGDGSSQGGSGEGDSGNGDNQGGDGGDGGGDGGDGEGDTFDRSYVEKLRKENADYRTRAKKAEDELGDIKKEQMSDIEKAQTERDEAKQRGDNLESELDRMRLQLAVTSAATSANFHDPEDALSLIDKGEISKNDEGAYNKQSVEAAVKRLADSKPHLVKGKNAGSGSGDGGARGQGGGNMTEEEKQEQYSKEFKEKGGVQIPKL